jgi:hypothetical protein
MDARAEERAQSEAEIDRIVVSTASALERSGDPESAYHMLAGAEYTHSRRSRFFLARRYGPFAEPAVASVSDRVDRAETDAADAPSGTSMEHDRSPVGGQARDREVVEAGRGGSPRFVVVGLVCAAGIAGCLLRRRRGAGSESNRRA